MTTSSRFKMLIQIIHGQILCPHPFALWQEIKMSVTSFNKGNLNNEILHFSPCQRKFIKSWKISRLRWLRDCQTTLEMKPTPPLQSLGSHYEKNFKMRVYLRVEFIKKDFYVCQPRLPWLLLIVSLYSPALATARLSSFMKLY